MEVGVGGLINPAVGDGGVQNAHTSELEPTAFFFFWRFDSCAEGDTRVEVLLVHRRAEGLMEVRALQVPENQHANILLFWKQVLRLPRTSWCLLADGNLDRSLGSASSVGGGGGSTATG